MMQVWELKLMPKAAGRPSSRRAGDQAIKLTKGH
jgi:hypothetical protein